MVGLSSGGGVPLVPWTTARYLSALTGDMREYYRLSGADVILDGSLRRLGADSLQLTVSWVDGVTAVFDAWLRVAIDLNNIAEGVQDLCSQISRRLGTVFSEVTVGQIEARQAESPAVRNLYQRARMANRLGTAGGVRESFAYLVRALEIQPDYPAALALKADTHIYSAVSGLGVAKTEMTAAANSVNRALKLAPNLAPALASKGGVLFAFFWDNAAAAKTRLAARIIDPASDSTHYWTEAVLATAEDPREAAAAMERHAENDSCSAATAYLACSYCYNARIWNRTEHWARRAIELDEHKFRPYPFLAGAIWKREERSRRWTQRNWHVVFRGRIPTPQACWVWCLRGWVEWRRPRRSLPNQGHLGPGITRH